MRTVIKNKEFGNIEIITRQYQQCSDCERWGTMDCPISYMCYSTKDKPYFKSRYNGK